MYITVTLLTGITQPLWYKVPANWPATYSIGSLVTVPLRNRVEAGIITSIHPDLPATCTFAVKPARSLEAFPADKQYQIFIAKLASYYCIDPITIIKRLKQFVQTQARQNTVIPPHTRTEQSVTLTDGQQSIVTTMQPYITHPEFVPLLLHGVTGSGKTEVYKELIIQTIQNKKTALLLLPEVTLALAFEQRLQEQLPSCVAVHGFHSATQAKVKQHVWKQLLQNKPLLIIGVHLPILLPITNLGFIVVDEEHESGYQEKKHPKINSKEAALIRAHHYKIPILLGSATPSITSMHNVAHKKWRFGQLKQRFAGSFPEVKIVSLQDNKQRQQFWLTPALKQAITTRLAKKEQTILFLNRRGFSFFVQCKNCSFIFECSNCSVSLTLHKDNRLHCHYCDFNQTLPAQCTACKADEKQLLKKGIGTQQLVLILQKLFPHATIARADLDTTKKKKEWNTTLEEFNKGTIDIIVGTQTITKGFHFPNVTLVGILWADLNLHFPFYHATETALQQLIQVAGRTGRAHKKGLVIVQTMRNHKVFAYVNEIDYLKFYRNELQERQELGYPPFARFAEIELKHYCESIVEKESAAISAHLYKNKRGVKILGPAKPIVHKVKKFHLRTIYLKGPNMHDLCELFNTLPQTYTSKISFVPNPL